MTAKLNDIAQLTDGWWGAGSRAISPSSIEMVMAVLPVACERHTHIAIAPHASGSLMLEWSFRDLEVTVELRPDGSMVLTQDNVVSDEYIEETVEATEGDLSRFILASTE